MTTRKNQMTLVRAIGVAMVLAFAGTTQASVTFGGSGINDEVGGTATGTAQFTISGNTLTIVLINTTAPRTTAQGNALTGVTFDINPGSPVLSLTSIALTGGSKIWTSKTASNTSDPLAGSWTSVLGSSPLGEYGAATTGFNNRFNGGSITLGNSSPNYGIVAANTFDGTNVTFGGSQFPFIQNSLTLTFSGVTGVKEAQLKNVNLLFGTDGKGIIKTKIVPTPGAMALLGVAGLAAARRRRAA